MTEERPVVVVIDDDISIRDALRNLFRSVGLTVQTFENAHDFLRAKRPDGPACLVLDVRLPGASGLDLQQQLIDADIQIPIIFITAHGDIRMSVRAMKAGAVEFLTKPFRDQELLDAVQEAISRNRDECARKVATGEIQRRYDALTTRERQVFELVVRGLANKQIAQELDITEPTVKLHRGRLSHKMKATSLADLIRMAEAIGIPPRGGSLPV